MAKMKKVSIRSIEEAVEGKTQDTTTVEFNGLEINVKRILPFYDMIRFVRSVVDGCFKDDDGSYIPEVKNFLIRIYVLAYYSNINLPQNVEKQYEFAYTTGLFETVIGHIEPAQFADICDAIDENIEYIVESNNKEMQSQIVSVQNMIKELGEQLNGLFDGVGNEDINSIFGAIADRGIDEEKLMRAYINNKNEST